MRRVKARPLTAEAFAPFGDVIALRDKPDRIINQGLCGRHHDLTALDVSDGRPAISLFDAEPRALPHRLDMMERHPAGSQAFLPMTENPFLVVVARDEDGRPGAPLAFLTAPGQGVNYARGAWHGVLTPLAAPGLFAVIDRVGPGENLEEFWFEEPWIIDA
ncbi:MAG: ureidoglycolate lyase [Pseudomonadota bacterium]